MKQFKMLGTSFLALSLLFVASCTEGRGANNGNASRDPYQGTYNGDASYSNGRNYSDSSGYNGTTSTYTKREQTTTYKRTPGQQMNGGCGNFDMNMFEGKDEEDAYSAYGYTRGDIYYIYRYKFDPNTVVVADGNVEKVIRVQYPDGDCYLVVILSTQDGDLLVNLGPVNYFDAQRVVIGEGDALQVKGSKIRLNGRYVLIGMEIVRDGKTIPLRNEAGQPTWKSDMEQGNMPGAMPGQPRATTPLKKY